MTVVLLVELSNIRDGLQCAFLRALMSHFFLDTSSRGMLTHHFLFCHFPGATVDEITRVLPSRCNIEKRL